MVAEFTTKRATLAGLAERAGAVVSASSLRPELRNFLVTVSPEEGIRLAATDLGLTVFASARGVTAGEAVTCQVPADRLTMLLREATEGEVTVAVHDAASDGIRLVRVTAGASFWDLRVPVTEFPELPAVADAEWHDVPRAPLLAALKAVRHAAGRDGANLAWACVSIAVNGDGSARVTAYDGGRLQQARLASFPFPTQIPALGSPAALDEVIRLLGINTDLDTVQTARSDHWLAFRIGSAVFVTQHLGVQGADVSKLVLAPAMENNQSLTVSRDGLLGAVRRVRVNADPQTSAIGLRLEPGKLTVVASDKFRNAAEEPLAAGWDGKERLVVVHHKFLTDMVGATTAAECQFWLAPESRGRKSVLLLRDDGAGVTGLIQQMAAKALGY
jgi:DNA polymerase III sliding clamp (beta) subunit (PCNA family)